MSKIFGIKTNSKKVVSVQPILIPYMNAVHDWGNTPSVLLHADISLTLGKNYSKLKIGSFNVNNQGNTSLIGTLAIFKDGVKTSLANTTTSVGSFSDISLVGVTTLRIYIEVVTNSQQGSGTSATAYNIAIS